MERRRRLADRLAVAAGELLPDRLDHPPLARHHVQRPAHVLAELTQAIAPAALASGRWINHYPFPWEVLGEGLALGAPARKSLHRCRLGHGPFRRQLIFGGIGLQLLEHQARRTLRPLSIDLML
jgi:hypothetical protein